MVRRRLTSFRSNVLLRRIAAAWFVRNRTKGEQPASFRDWVAVDPRHEQEYGRIEATWRALEVLEEDAESRRVAARASDGFWPTLRRAVAPLAAVMVLGLAIGCSLWLAYADQQYKTGVGDQRVVSLADGSLVTLNTDSRVDVQVDEELRRVRLDQGEAFFDVASLPAGPPFEVIGGGVKIRVVGTRFNVRITDQGVGLDVIEGRVEIRRADSASGDALRPVVLTAGQRADFDLDGVVLARGTTDPQRVTCWRLGRVELNDTPLHEAVREMNRYSDRKLVIDSPDIGDLRVSGVFRVGNVESFANALRLSSGLQVVATDEQILITESHQSLH